VRSLARYRPAADLLATYSIGEPTSLQVALVTIGWFFFRLAKEG
jgi:hypothetical protein